MGQPATCLISGSQRTTVTHATITPITVQAMRSFSCRPALSFDRFSGFAMTSHASCKEHGSYAGVPLSLQ